MTSRLDLHKKLQSILGKGYVYFQPPASVDMKYPAIVYKRNRVRTGHGNDKMYNSRQSYTITVIDPDPDSVIPNNILTGLEYCSSERHFTINNLNHDVFNVFI